MNLGYMLRSAFVWSSFLGTEAAPATETVMVSRTDLLVFLSSSTHIMTFVFIPPYPLFLAFNKNQLGFSFGSGLETGVAVLAPQLFS